MAEPTTAPPVNHVSTHDFGPYAQVDVSRGGDPFQHIAVTISEGNVVLSLRLDVDLFGRLIDAARPHIAGLRRYHLLRGLIAGPDDADVVEDDEQAETEVPA